MRSCLHLLFHHVQQPELNLTRTFLLMQDQGKQRCKSETKSLNSYISLILIVNDERTEFLTQTQIF